MQYLNLIGTSTVTGTSTTTAIEDPSVLIQAIVDAAQNGQWLVLIGASLALVAWALRSFVVRRVSTATGAILMAVVTFAGGLGGVFMTAAPGTSAGSIILQGVGLAASSGLVGILLSKATSRPVQAPVGQPPAGTARPNVKKPEPPEGA